MPARAAELQIRARVTDKVCGAHHQNRTVSDQDRGARVAAPFSIHADREGHAIDLRLGGDLDLAARSDLRAHVDRYLGDATVSVVNIDLAGLTFIDSSGIGALVGCVHSAHRADKALHATGAQGQVAKALDLTGVTPLIAGAVPPIDPPPPA
jgi:anti-sigma B factor antagonist